MTQAYPLAMVAYGIGVLPLIKNMKALHPDITHTRYAGNAGTMGKFFKI